MRLAAFESSSPHSPAWRVGGTTAEGARNEAKRIARKSLNIR